MTAELPTIAAAARGFRDGTLSPVDLTALCLERIGRYDRHLHAYHAVFADEAMAAARAAEDALGRGDDLGPLHGIPIALKDVFYWRGKKTSSNSRVMLDFEAGEDAGVITRLKAAGAVLLGQLNTYEFTFGGRPSTEPPFPPALNPWNTGRITGGSSSGSGAAVAAGLCLGALGTDAGGSIRLPAAFCGIAGLKPTIGRVSAYGDMPLTYSFDCVGPMAWTSEDAAIMLQALAGHDPRDPMSADVAVPDYVTGLEDGVKGLRVGLIRHFYTGDFASPPEIVAAIDGVAETLAGLGAEMEEVCGLAAGRLACGGARPGAGRGLRDPRGTAANPLGRVWAARAQPADAREPVPRRRLHPGAASADRAAGRARSGARALRYRGHHRHADPDAAARRHRTLPLHRRADHRHSVQPDRPSLPCNVRAGFFADGMPIGAQIAGRHWDEATVLRAAHAFERAAGLLDRRPPLDG